MKAVFIDTLSSKYAVTVLDYIFTNPIFRNSSVAANSLIPPATATRITSRLEEEGFLVEMEKAAGRRSALYSFEPLLELVRI